MSKRNKYYTLEEQIKYVTAIENGDSVKHVSRVFGIDRHALMVLWLKYQRGGMQALLDAHSKQYKQYDSYSREVILRDIEDNCLTLSEAAAKHNVSRSSIKQWRKQYREGGIDALYEVKKPGRPLKDQDMGRPRKKKPEEMTELERLKYENECLRAENALLKKVRALVEEREARLREIGRKPSKN